MGAIFAVLFYPWMRRIELGWFPNSLAAGLFTLAVTVVLFIPIATMTVSGVKSGLKELKQIKHLNTDAGGTSSDEFLDKMFTSAGSNEGARYEDPFVRVTAPRAPGALTFTEPSPPAVI